MTSPEPLPDIVHGTLHLPFDPRAVRRASLRTKSIVMCKVEEFLIEVDLACHLSDENVLEVIVKNLYRGPLQVVKGMDVPVQESFQGTTLHKLHIESPRVSRGPCRRRERYSKSHQVPRS